MILPDEPPPPSGCKFDPVALNSTARELEEATQPARPATGEEKAQREIADCDAKLRQHRAALEAGADPPSAH